MGQVKLDIGGRSFNVTCQDGEEAHLTKLATMVSEKAGEAGDPAVLTESRMLLFTSLLLADELHGTKSATPAPALESSSSPAAPSIDEKTLVAMEKLADRAETLADSFEQT